MPSAVSSVFADLVRFETRLWNAVEVRLLDEYAITFGRFEVLQVVGTLPSCRVNDIADELAITWGGASKLVDRLEAADLCKRRPNPDDGRSSLIELTATGKRLLTKARRLVDDELDAGFGDILTARGFEQFASAITKLRQASDEWSRDEVSA